MSAGVRALVVAAGLGLVGCRARSPDDRLAGDVARGITRDLGVTPTRVTCAGSGCVALLGGVDLAVTVAGEPAAAERTWQSDEVVLASAVAAHVAGQLADLGVTAAVDCGPAVQPVPADGRLSCAIAGGGRAWVRLGAGDELTVDVALSAAEVTAREEAEDEEALDRASRALDSDEAEGSEADDDGADAGVDALPRGPAF